MINALRPKPDDITGHVAVIVDVTTGKQRIGRLGWKAQHASLLGFAGDAYLNEMGLTNRFFPTENGPNGNQALLAPWIKTSGLDDPPDPATGRSDIDAAADFMRLLAPPPPLQRNASAQAGQRLFSQMRCDACHQPVLFSGASSINPLAYKPVPLHSDLLLHDMGSLGDGIEQSARMPTRSRPRRSGACACARLCCTTAAPRPSPTPSSATPAKRRRRATGSPA